MWKGPTYPSFVQAKNFEKFLKWTVISCVLSLSGGELFDRIAAEDYKMSEAEVINYMRQVCEGLKHMHENSIVHLDVKVSQSKQRTC